MSLDLGTRTLLVPNGQTLLPALGRLIACRSARFCLHAKAEVIVQRGHRNSQNGGSVIARIGYFSDFDLSDREYVIEAIKGQSGFRGVYHLVHPETGRALSISFFDSDDDAQEAQRAVGAAREAGGHGGPSPDRVEKWDVLRHAS
jgi:hypothetical protein